MGVQPRPGPLEADERGAKLHWFAHLFQERNGHSDRRANGFIGSDWNAALSFTTCRLPVAHLPGPHLITSLLVCSPITRSRLSSLAIQAPEETAPHEQWRSRSGDELKPHRLAAVQELLDEPLLWAGHQDNYAKADRPVNTEHCFQRRYIPSSEDWRTTRWRGWRECWLKEATGPNLAARLGELNLD